MGIARCAILGMDANTRYSYEYFLRNFGDGRYFLAERDEDANILLIDIDTVDGRRIAQQVLVRSDSRQVPIVISANASHPENTLFLQKPGAPSALRAVLEKALLRVQDLAFVTPEQAAPSSAPERLTLGHDDKGHASAALAMESEHFNHYMFRYDKAVAGEQGERFFDPNDFLYGTLRRAWDAAREKGRVVELRWDLPSIRLCPRERLVQIGMSDKVMRSMAVTHVRPKIALLSEARCSWRPESPPEPIERVLWRLAVWTSRGRLPVGCNPDARVRLLRWPNMTRLLPTPHGMQIAALWTSGAYTFAETARQLMTSRGDVHMFYCAADALGLIDHVDGGANRLPAAPDASDAGLQAVPTAPPVVPPATVPPPRAEARGLLSRILSRLVAR